MRKPTKIELFSLSGLVLSCAALGLVGNLFRGERQKTADAVATNQALAAGAIQLAAEITADPAATDAEIAATSTLAATNTLEPTFTPLPLASATPFPIDRFISRRPDDSLISIDRRDAWGSLPNFDADGNNQIDDPELTPAAAQLNLWTDSLRQAYLTGVLGDQTVTTYEKLAEIHGFIAENFDRDFNWHPIDEFGRFADELNSFGALGIATTADRLSETMVRLSEELAELGRQKNPAGSVKTPDQIFNGITANLNLEGKWQPGIDPRKVDEIRLQCFTFREKDGYERQDQPEVIEKDVWDQELRPSVPIELGQEWRDASGVGHFSNDGLIAVVVKVVSAAQLDGVKDILAQENHQAAFTEIVSGWWAVTMEFDMSERWHSPEDAVEADQVRGSGGQLIECGPGAGPRPEITATWTPAGPVFQITPAETTLPGVTSPPLETPPPPQETPRPTSVPTQPTQPPRDTESPPSTPQDPEPTHEPGPTDAGTPVPPPPIADTPASEVVVTPPSNPTPDTNQPPLAP